MAIKQDSPFSYTFQSRWQKETARHLVGHEEKPSTSSSRHSPLARDMFSRRLMSPFLTTDPKQAPSVHSMLKQPDTFDSIKEKLFRLGLVLEVKFDGHDGKLRPVLMARPLQGFLPKQRAPQTHLQLAERITKNLVQIEGQAELLFHSLQELKPAPKGRSGKNTDDLKNSVTVLADMLGSSPEAFTEGVQNDPRMLSYAALAAEKHNASLVFVPLRDTPYVLPNRPLVGQPRALLPLPGSRTLHPADRITSGPRVRSVLPNGRP